MTASLGIWAEGSTSGGVLYRWEADRGDSGFAVFDPATRRLRPADSQGTALGDLVVDDAVDGGTTGSAEGVDPGMLARVAASILRAYARSGEPPRTAHAHFY